MEKEKLMQQEIEEKRKLTEEIKNKIDNKEFYNFWIAVAVLAYMIVVNFAYIKIDINEFKVFIKFATIILTFVIVSFFEISYRKDNLKYTLTAIELLILNLVVMYIPYIYTNQNIVLRRLIMLVPIYFGVYFSIKNCIIYKKEEFHHKNNLSDIKEILKEDDESYLEEKSTKIIKERKNKKTKKK